MRSKFTKRYLRDKKAYLHRVEDGAAHYALQGEGSSARKPKTFTVPIRAFKVLNQVEDALAFQIFIKEHEKELLER